MSDDEQTDYGIGDHHGDSDEGDDHGTDDHTTEGHDGGHGSSGHGGGDHDARVTSPMQSYSTTQVAWGGVVLVIGLLLTFGIGLAL